MNHSLAAISYLPVEGKTYSLFGNSDTTTDYYLLIKELADCVLKISNNQKIVLEIIRKISKKKHILRKFSSEKKNSQISSYILHLLNNSLSDYTANVESHLQNMPILKFGDRRLRTTREQYHLYMLEIELTNRIFAPDFKNTDKKIALLPHCLKDFTVNCKSEPDDFDYRCKQCSKNCFLNYSGKILRQNNIHAYIWMGAGLKQKLKTAIKSNSTIGILGIACIPELVWGMRRCCKYRIPVIGIPLDANRCIRWMGSFNPNSVNLDQLEKLIT